MAINNDVKLEGRIVSDAQTKSLPSGLTVATFTLAVDRPFRKDKEKEVDYLDCQLFGKRADALKDRLTKGAPVKVTGVLRQDRWKDKETQKTRSKIVINVDDIDVRKAYSGKATENRSPQEQVASSSKPEEDIPF
jgi:single-strand DNA-binding protein